MIETIGHLKRLGLDGAVCIGVHGLFAQHAYEELSSSGAARIATSNSVRHESNDINLTPLLASAVREWLCDRRDIRWPDMNMGSSSQRYGVEIF
jgi:ribose-phosphate pyrophosphokinase